jgi:hypothetical protein
MRILLLLFAFSSIIFFSCQKEKDFANGNSGGGGGGNTSGTKLVKTVSKAGSDSTVTEFSYNSLGKIVGFKVSGVESGQPLDLRLTYIRNSSGIIQKQILKSNELTAAGIDSIVTVVNYDAANNRYKGGVSKFTIFGLEIKDSVVFTYDATGRFIYEIDYNDIGFAYLPSWKKEYTYAGNNLAGDKFYSYNAINDTYDLEETSIYEYDSKINPLQFASEASVLNMNPFYSANNITKETYVDATDPSNNYVSAETYVYNSSNRPSTSTNVTGTDTYTTTYYYQ